MPAVVEPGAGPGADDSEEDDPISGGEFPAYVREAYMEVSALFLIAMVGMGAKWTYPSS